MLPEVRSLGRRHLGPEALEQGSVFLTGPFSHAKTLPTSRTRVFRQMYGGLAQMDVGSHDMERRRTLPTAPKDFRREWSMAMDYGREGD